MTDKALAHAYDEACAVLSAPVRFVEWKMYEARGPTPKDWSPFGVARGRVGAWKEIEGDRWIYVFNAHINVDQNARWVEEIRLSKGALEATPMAQARVEPQKRPAGVPVG